MAAFPCPNCGEELNPSDQIKEGLLACGGCWKYVELPKPQSQEREERSCTISNSNAGKSRACPATRSTSSAEEFLGLAVISGIALTPLVILWVVGGWLLIVKTVLWITILASGMCCWRFYTKNTTILGKPRGKVDLTTKQKEQQELLLSAAILTGILSCSLLMGAAVILRGPFLFVAALISVSVAVYTVLYESSSQSFRRIAARTGPSATVAVVLVIVWLAGTSDVPRPLSNLKDGPSATIDAQPQPERVLVITVPGTFGNSRFWSKDSPRRVSFASEVRRGLGEDSTIYPFIWAAPVSHQARCEAARNLAEIIDVKASDYDRVCVIGHSHGGNVALLASALCAVRIDTIVCLSTPHVYLKTRNLSGDFLLLPVYCTKGTVNNVDNIVSISPDSDAVVDGWADLWTGLTENNAIALARPWLESLEHPRLADDSPDFLVFRSEGKNLSALRMLPNFANTRNVVYHSQAANGIDAHRAVHSRRMGFVVGQLLQDDPSEEKLRYLRTLIQPRYEDDGEPIEHQVAEVRNRRRKKNGSFDHCAWRLVHANVKCVIDSRTLAHDLNGSPPDLFLEGRTGTHISRTVVVNDANKANWFKTGIVFWPKNELTICICDSDFLSRTELHSYLIPPSNVPPTRFDAKPESEWFWEAQFEWQSLHY